MCILNLVTRFIHHLKSWKHALSLQKWNNYARLHKQSKIREKYNYSYSLAMQFLKASRWGQQCLRFAEWALIKAAIDKSRWLYGTLFLNKHKINKRALNEKKTLIAAVFNSVAAGEEYKSKKKRKITQSFSCRCSTNMYAWINQSKL